MKRPQQRSSQMSPSPGITMQRLSLRTGRGGDASYTAVPAVAVADRRHVTRQH